MTRQALLDRAGLSIAAAAGGGALVPVAIYEVGLPTPGWYAWAAAIAAMAAAWVALSA